MSSDFQLVQNLKERKDENQSLDELVNRHIPLCLNVYRQYESEIQNSGVPIDELVDESPCLVYESALSYEPRKNTKFSTWLAFQARFKCSHLISKNKNMIYGYDLDEIIDSSTQNSMQKAETLEYIKDIIGQFKDERIKKVFDLRYDCAYTRTRTWNEIAKKIGVTRQTVKNLHEKGIKLLINKINNNSTTDKI